MHRGGPVIDSKSAAELVVIAMVVIALELEHREQIADRWAVQRHIGIVFASAIGLGRLSRLRALSGARRQLRSMNFRIETWSA
jgi:hypothetical protein